MSNVRSHMRAPRFEPYALLCALPWLLAAYEYRYGSYHVDADHLFELKAAFLWTLLVAVSGLVLAGVKVWRSRSDVAGMFAMCATGFLVWFPWDILPRIIQL